MTEQTDDMTATELCAAALDSGDPIGYLRRFRDRQSDALRAGLLAKYAERPVTRFTQYDGFTGVDAEPWAFPTEADADGEVITCCETNELMHGAPVRVLIRADDRLSATTIERLLHKIAATVMPF